MPKSKVKQVVPSLESNCRQCDRPDNSLMVLCDTCEKWYHFECAGVDSDVADREWSCVRCAGFQAQLPTEFSTPLNGANAQKTPERPGDDDLRKQLVFLQQRLDQQQTFFEEQLRRKDEEREQALRKQHDDMEYEQYLVRKKKRDAKAEDLRPRPTGTIPKGSLKISTNSCELN